MAHLPKKDNSKLNLHFRENETEFQVFVWFLPAEDDQQKAIRERKNKNKFFTDIVSSQISI